MRDDAYLTAWVVRAVRDGIVRGIRRTAVDMFEAEDDADRAVAQR